MKYFNKIGFGTYRISIKNNEHVESLTYALKSGITVIDTSTNYVSGEAEQAIAKAFQNSGVHREKVTIISKAGYIQGNLLKQVQNGRIRSYGISSNSFAKSSDSLHFLPYTHLLDLAEEAKAETGSSKHHFIPFSFQSTYWKQKDLNVRYGQNPKV